MTQMIRVNSDQNTKYPPARGPVLLLSCMDLRLLDEIVDFMDHDGLTNRYDHVILAGASLGALGGCKKEYKHWKKTFFDHLEAAIDLHRVKDVYILEHRDCGAYIKFLGEKGEFTDETLNEEHLCHQKYAHLLKDEIQAWCSEKKLKLNVKAFLMDLRGDVEVL